MTTTTKRDTRTAAQAYMEHTETIRRAIDKLEAALKRHSKEFMGPEGHIGKNWGFVGDLAEVEGLVGRAVRFMNGEEE